MSGQPRQDRVDTQQKSGNAVSQNTSKVNVSSGVRGGGAGPGGGPRNTQGAVRGGKRATSNGAVPAPSGRPGSSQPDQELLPRLNGPATGGAQAADVIPPPTPQASADRGAPSGNIGGPVPAPSVSSASQVGTGPNSSMAGEPVRPLPSNGVPSLQFGSFGPNSFEGNVQIPPSRNLSSSAPPNIVEQQQAKVKHDSQARQQPDKALSPQQAHQPQGRMYGQQNMGPQGLPGNYGQPGAQGQHQGQGVKYPQGAGPGQMMAGAPHNVQLMGAHMGQQVSHGGAQVQGQISHQMGALGGQMGHVNQNASQYMPPQSSPSHFPQRASKALKIVDPKTKQAIEVERPKDVRRDSPGGMAEPGKGPGGMPGGGQGLVGQAGDGQGVPMSQQQQQRPPPTHYQQQPQMQPSVTHYAQPHFSYANTYGYGPPVPGQGGKQGVPTPPGTPGTSPQSRYGGYGVSGGGGPYMGHQMGGQVLQKGGHTGHTGGHSGHTGLGVPSLQQPVSTDAHVHPQGHVYVMPGFLPSQQQPVFIRTAPPGQPIPGLPAPMTAGMPRPMAPSPQMGKQGGVGQQPPIKFGELDAHGNQVYGEMASHVGPDGKISGYGGGVGSPGTGGYLTPGPQRGGPGGPRPPGPPQGPQQMRPPGPPGTPPTGGARGAPGNAPGGSIQQKPGMVDAAGKPTGVVTTRDPGATAAGPQQQQLLQQQQQQQRKPKPGKGGSGPQRLPQQQPAPFPSGKADGGAPHAPELPGSTSASPALPQGPSAWPTPSLAPAPIAPQVPAWGPNARPSGPPAAPAQQAGPAVVYASAHPAAKAAAPAAGSLPAVTQPTGVPGPPVGSAPAETPTVEPRASAAMQLKGAWAKGPITNKPAVAAAAATPVSSDSKTPLVAATGAEQGGADKTGVPVVTASAPRAGPVGALQEGRAKAGGATADGAVADAARPSAPAGTTPDVSVVTAAQAQRDDGNAGKASPALVGPSTGAPPVAASQGAAPVVHAPAVIAAGPVQAAPAVKSDADSAPKPGLKQASDAASQGPQPPAPLPASAPPPASAPAPAAAASGSVWGSSGGLSKVMAPPKKAAAVVAQREAKEAASKNVREINVSVRAAAVAQVKEVAETNAISLGHAAKVAARVPDARPDTSPPHDGSQGPTGRGGVAAEVGSESVERGPGRGGASEEVVDRQLIETTGETAPGRGLVSGTPLGVSGDRSAQKPGPHGLLTGPPIDTFPEATLSPAPPAVQSAAGSLAAVQGQVAASPAEVAPGAGANGVSKAADRAAAPAAPTSGTGAGPARAQSGKAANDSGKQVPPKKRAQKDTAASVAAAAPPSAEAQGKEAARGASAKAEAELAAAVAVPDVPVLQQLAKTDAREAVTPAGAAETSAAQKPPQQEGAAAPAAASVASAGSPSAPEAGVVPTPAATAREAPATAAAGGVAEATAADVSTPKAAAAAQDRGAQQAPRQPAAAGKSTGALSDKEKKEIAKAEAEAEQKLAALVAEAELPAAVTPEERAGGVAPARADSAGGADATAAAPTAPASAAAAAGGSSGKAAEAAPAATAQTAGKAGEPKPEAPAATADASEAAPSAGSQAEHEGPRKEDGLEEGEIAPEGFSTAQVAADGSGEKKAEVAAGPAKESVSSGGSGEASASEQKQASAAVAVGEDAAAGVSAEGAAPTEEATEGEAASAADSRGSVAGAGAATSSNTSAAAATNNKKKKNLKQLLAKADAAGADTNLYNAYNLPVEEAKKDESSGDARPEAAKEKAAGSKESLPAMAKPPAAAAAAAAAAEVDDWEDAAGDIPTPRPGAPGGAGRFGAPGGGLGGAGGGGMARADSGGVGKYSRDFLLTLRRDCRDLPPGFDFHSHMALMSDLGQVVAASGGPLSPLDRRGPRGGPPMGREQEDDRWARGSHMGGPGGVAGGVLASPGGFRPGGSGGPGPHPGMRGPPGPGMRPGGAPPGMGMPGPPPRVNGIDADKWQKNPQKVGAGPPRAMPVMQQMHKTENRYQVGAVTDEEQKKQRLIKAILNKLTPQNFDRLFQQVKDANIDSPETLTNVISQIFDKALLEPTFCEMYAAFCLALSKEMPVFDPEGQKITFKRVLLNKCQEEFERGVAETQEAERAEGDGEEKISDEERAAMRVKARKRMLGNIRFIGELYRTGMLTERIMHECIKTLLGEVESPDEEDVEALCKLMMTIGNMIDHPKAKEHIDAYMSRIEKLASNQKLSSRIRFMLRDVVDLRRNGWQARRKVEGPKKIEDVHRDAVKERHEAYPQQGGGAGGGGGLMGMRGGPMPPGSGGGMGRQDPRGEEQRYMEAGKPVLLSSQRNQGSEQKFFGPQGSLGRKGMGPVPGGGGGMGMGMGPSSRSALADGPGGGMGGAGPDRDRFGGGREGPDQYFRPGDRDPRDGRGNMDRYQGPGPERGGAQGSAAGGRDFRGGPSDRFGPAGPADRERSDRSWGPGGGGVAGGGSGSRPVTPPNPGSRPTSPLVAPGAGAGETGDSSGGPRGEAAAAAPVLDEKAMVKKSKAIIDEYYGLKDKEEAASCVEEELASPAFYPAMVSQWVVSSLLDRGADREALTKLFVHLAQKSPPTLTTEHLVKGFLSVVEQWEDIAMDAPLAAPQVGAMLGSLVAEGVLPLASVGALLQAGCSASEGEFDGALKVLQAVLDTVRSAKGAAQVAELFKGAQIQVAALVPAYEKDREKVAEAFLEKAGLGSPLKAVEKYLSEAFAKDEAASDVIHWLEESGGAAVSDAAFARLLFTLFLRSALSSSSQKEQFKVALESKVGRYAELLKRFSRGKTAQANQLSYVYAAQQYVHDAKPPSGLLTIIFSVLYNCDVVPEDVFLKWKDNLNDGTPGKHEAFVETMKWFQWLETAQYAEDSK
eukprot:jgi/Mesen1/2925/ME000175S02080